MALSKVLMLKGYHKRKEEKEAVITGQDSGGLNRHQRSLGTENHPWVTHIMLSFQRTLENENTVTT